MRQAVTVCALILLSSGGLVNPVRGSNVLGLTLSSVEGSLSDHPTSPAPEHANLVAPELAGKTARAIQFRGNTQLSSDTLRRLMMTKSGQPIDPAQVERDLSALEKAYHRRGFILMRALSPDPLSPDGVLMIPIHEGVVESIEVVGNKKTRRWVILRQMETQPGSVYNENTVRDDRQRLANLGIFKDVQVGSAGGTELGKAIVSVKVSEARSAELFTTLGYSSKTGLIGYFYGQEDNLAGTARQVNARWERFPITNGTAFQGGFYTPWSFLPRTSLRLTGYHTSPYHFVYSTGDIDSRNIRSYEVRSGGAVQLARELTVRNQLLFGFRNDSVSYDDLPFDVRIPSGYSTDVGPIRVFSLGLANDTRNLPFNPRRGGIHSLNVEFGHVGDGGGNFVRYTANIRRYLPAGGARVFANRLILGASSGSVPLPELFWLGGPDSLRGYDRDSFYGRSMAALTSELRIPIGTGMQAVGFVDAGHASGSGGLRGAIGAGLRVVTPIGPLRLDFALGANGVRSHFTAGYAAF
jgi:outer membrane protein insertion porin family